MKLKQKVDLNLKQLVEEQKKIELKLKNSQKKNDSNSKSNLNKRTGSPNYSFIRNNHSPINTYSHIQSRVFNHYSDEKKLRQVNWKSPSISSNIKSRL